MRIKDFGKYNCSDTLLEVEYEMKTHVEALQQTRTALESLLEDCCRLSDQICYLETILDSRGIEYDKTEI